MESGPVLGTDSKITGSNGYEETADSDVVVITSGIARKPGMSRDDLLLTNMKIVGSVTEEVVKHSPNSIIIVVSNPLDAMVQHAYNISGFDSKRVIGMAGILDTARFSTFIAEELNVSVESVNAYVLGGHGDTMVPVIGATNVGGVPVENMIEKNKLASIVQRTRDGGAEIVKFLEKGSAFYAPAASGVEMAKAYLKDEKKLLPCAAYLKGEYGINDIYAGVPIIVGKNGVEKIEEINLDQKEKEDYNE